MGMPPIVDTLYALCDDGTLWYIKDDDGWTQLPAIPAVSPLPETMIDPKLEQRRQDYLEWLYQRSGRTCSTYTGLYQERLKELIERDMQEAGL